MEYIKHYISKEAYIADLGKAKLSTIEGDDTIYFDNCKPYEMLLIYNDGHAVVYHEEDMDGVNTVIDNPTDVIEAIFNTEDKDITGTYNRVALNLPINKLTTVQKLTFYKLSESDYPTTRFTHRCVYIHDLHNLKVLDLRTLNYKDLSIMVNVENCQNLEEIYLPDNCNIIRGRWGNSSTYLAKKCPNLKKIVFGNNVDFYISSSSHYISLDSTAAEEVIFGSLNNAKYTKRNIYSHPIELQNYESKMISSASAFMLRDMPYLKKLVLPENTIGLPVNFLYHSYIKELDFPYSLKCIDVVVGADLESIIIPDTIEYIGYNCLRTNSTTKIQFKHKGSTTTHPTTSVNKKYNIESNAIIENNAKYLIKGCRNTKIPTYVLSIGEYALAGLKANSFNIPNNVKSLDYDAFNSSKFTNLVFRSEIPAILKQDKNLGTIDSKVEDIYVPATAVEAYKTATNWTLYADKIKPITDTILTLTDDTTVAIQGSSLTKALISDVYKETLKSVEIGKGVTSIEGAFEDCTLLESVTGLDTVTEIGSSAFKNCSALTSIEIPSALTIGYDAFKGCTNLIDIKISMPCVCTIHQDTLPDNENLTIQVLDYLLDDYLKDNVWSNYSNKLKWIPNSTKLTLSDNTIVDLGLITTISAADIDPYRGQIKYIEIGNQVTTIGEGAFENATGVQDSVYIWKSVTSIGERAFAGYTAGNFYLEGNNLEIPGSAFGYNRSTFVKCRLYLFDTNTINYFIENYETQYKDTIREIYVPRSEYKRVYDHFEFTGFNVYAFNLDTFNYENR